VNFPPTPARTELRDGFVPSTERGFAHELEGDRAQEVVCSR
jgi:hypothetical protein